MNNELYHHGVLGMKWGVRRYQNEDGTLTDVGKKRYQANSIGKINTAKGLKRRLNDVDQAMAFHKRTIKDTSKSIDKLKSKGVKPSSVMTKTLSDSKKYIQQGEKETKKLLKYASSKNMVITSRDTYRSTARGKQKALAYGLAIGVGGVIGGGAGGAVYMYKSEKGTRYNIKNNK